MPTEPDEPRTDEEFHDEGGPVKSFLDHLEDLRWVLIKSLAALGIGMLICLIAGDQVVRIIKWPLTQAKARYPGTNEVWTITWGTNTVKVLRLTDEQQEKFGSGPRRYKSWKIDLLPNGTNGFLLGMSQDPNTDPKTAEAMKIDLINLSPVGGFFVALQVSLYGGTVLAAPFIFYFVAGFIFPALRMKEKHYVYRGLGFGLVLFSIGVAQHADFHQRQQDHRQLEPDSHAEHEFADETDVVFRSPIVG